MFYINQQGIDFDVSVNCVNWSVMCKPNPPMRKFILIFTLFILYKATQAQYNYRGQVFSAIRQEPITFGVLRLPSPQGTGRHGEELAKIDSLGYFSLTLKDTANVRVVVVLYSHIQSNQIGSSAKV